MSTLDLSEFGITGIGTTEVQPDTTITEEIEFDGISFGEVMAIPNKRKQSRTSKLSDRVAATYHRGPGSDRKIVMSEPQPIVCSCCNRNAHILFKHKDVIVGCILCQPRYISTEWVKG